MAHDPPGDDHWSVITAIAGADTTSRLLQIERGWRDAIPSLFVVGKTAITSAPFGLVSSSEVLRR